MLLAALPATPVQLVHACYQLGYEIVVPASWGDELVAQGVLEDLRQRDRDPVIQCTCPLVAERLLASGKYLLPSMVRTASPPVAAARYARAVFAPRPLHVTYIGACPGARNEAIDQRYLPDEFLQLLDERGTVLADMPSVFDSVLPPDRRRFFSIPGGCPTQEALWQATDGRMLREVTQPTFATDLAQTLVWREYVMIDVAPSLGCACSGTVSRLGPRSGRVAVMAVEPPRAEQPIVVHHPDFVAPEGDVGGAPKPPEIGNGKPPQPVEVQDDRGDQRAWQEERPARVSEPIAAARARPPRGGLPRAYLAKRRHLTPPHATPRFSHPGADRPERTELSGEPNESPEVARQIAVHVEPEALPAQADRDEEGTAADAERIDFSYAASLSEAETIPETGVQLTDATETVQEATADDSDQRAAIAVEPEWEAPPAATVSETVAAAADAGAQPLRVEVEIYDEPEALAPEVIVPDAVRHDERIKPLERVAEVPTRPLRPWADLLIALWLVLAASAVIAALLWRR